MTGQSFAFPENLGKKKSLIALLAEDCFASATGTKTAPSGVVLRPARLSLARSADLDGRVNAKSITVRSVSCLSGMLLSSVCPSRYANTLDMSHVPEYFGSGGRD